MERLQRTFRDEFYTRPLPTRVSELQVELNAYLDYYNRRRPHMALGGLAPLGQPEGLSWVPIFHNRYSEEWGGDSLPPVLEVIPGQNDAFQFLHFVDEVPHSGLDLKDLRYR